MAVPPATAVIMNDLGEDQAGDGGAVDELARQVGGALGVRDHRHGLRGDLHESDRRGAGSAFPDRQRERAAESIEEARDVVGGVGGLLHDQLTMRVDDASTWPPGSGFGVCVAVLLLAAAVATATLAPDRS